MPQNDQPKGQKQGQSKQGQPKQGQLKQGQSKQGLGPRKAALYLLDQVTGQGKLLPELIGEGALQHLPTEDRARAQRLAIETLRGLARADRMVARFMQKTPPLSVRNVLRLCTVELANGEAAHGVVNAGVELVARNKRTASMKGLVNAVLRKVAAEGPEGWEKLAVPAHARLDPQTSQRRLRAADRRGDGSCAICRCAP